jgi:hypothetical protein
LNAGDFAASAAIANVAAARTAAPLVTQFIFWPPFLTSESNLSVFFASKDLYETSRHLVRKEKVNRLSGAKRHFAKGLFRHLDFGLRP